MAVLPWLAALAAVVLTALALYWLVVLTEGVYLGPRAVTGLYNRVAGRYDGIKQFDDEDEAYFLGRPVARFLAADPGQGASGGLPWLLDVAAGTGRLSLAVLRASGAGCRVVVLDRASAMLREARRKLSGQGWDDVVYLVHDASRLPFAADQFCVVACLEALEFMPQPAVALAELVRVAQPGGLLVLSNRIGREARLMPGRIFSREEFVETLRTLGAAGVEVMPWQVDYDLVLAVKQGVRLPATAQDWSDKLQCPGCGKSLAHVPVDAVPQALVCSACGWQMALLDGLWQAAPPSTVNLEDLPNPPGLLDQRSA